MNNFKLKKSYRKSLVYVGVFTIFLFTASCFAPATKDAYLKQFNNFIENVGEDHHNYKKSDWEYADKRFDKFSKSWYKKFKEELTLKEQLKVGALSLKYHTYKNHDKLGGELKKEIEREFKNLKEKLNEYVDNEMDEDIEQLIEGAEVIGDSLAVAVEELIEGIVSNF